MKKITLIFIISIASLAQLRAQIDTTIVLDSAYKQAVAMSDAFLRGDYDSYVDYMHPAIVVLAGGRDSLINTLTASSQEGITFKSTKVSRPNNLVSTDSTIQCLMEQVLEVRIYGSDMTMYDHLLGISYDEGRSWVFLNASQEALEQMKEALPEISNDLHIPATRAPVIRK